LGYLPRPPPPSTLWSIFDSDPLSRQFIADLIGQRIVLRRSGGIALGGAGPNAPQIIYPAWPGSYPQAHVRRLFHVTAFGPRWAEETMKIAEQACNAAKPRVKYLRGDQVLESDIIRSIWDNLCQASHVLVDLTGLNANVALELGITHTLGRRTLIVTQDSAVEKYFPAIGKTRMHRYSLSGEPGLNSLLDRFLAEHD
jgi:hypothetical protein